MSSSIKKISLTVVICAVLYSALGFLILPYVATQQTKKIIESQFGVTPEIEGISFNPFTFEAVVTGFKLPAPADSTLGSPNRLNFDKFSLQLAIFPLFKKEILLKSVVLKNAHTQFIVFKNRTTNWAIKNDKTQSETHTKSRWTLTLEHLQIDNSDLNLVDNTHVSQLVLPLGPFSLMASNISTTLGNQTAISSLAISVGNKGHLKVSGDLGQSLRKIPPSYCTV